MNEPISVLIVDDHPVVRQGIRTFLETQPDIVIVGEAGSGREALAIVREQVPDVALVDLVLPEIDGVEVTRQIRRVSPRTQVVVLTSYDDDQYIFPALQAGAISFILKEVTPAELLEAIRRAARGEAVLHTRVALRVIREVRGGSALINPFTELTKRELEVLKLVAEGLSNAEIADRLFITQKTVKDHISNILSKLHLADRTQAAVYAWRQGLMQRPAESQTPKRRQPGHGKGGVQGEG